MSAIDIHKRCYDFALRIIKAYKFLNFTKGEGIMSKQLLRSGTAIGALMREAKFAQSRADFVSKVSIALKEANESQYWLSLFHDSGYIGDDVHQSIDDEIGEIISILASIVKKTKENTQKYDLGKSSKQNETCFVGEDFLLTYSTDSNQGCIFS